MSEERAYYDGAYTVKKRADGGLEFLLYQAPWPAVANLRFNNLVGVMFREQLEADAQIAALTERLRAVEAERDALIKDVLASVPEPIQPKVSGESPSWHAAVAVANLNARRLNHEADLSALRTELERKDAALRRLESASVAVDKAWHYEARQGDGIMEEHEPQELELQMALIDARAALENLENNDGK